MVKRVSAPRALACAGVVLAGCQAAVAQEAPAVAPEAVMAVRDMGQRLRDLPGFRIEADVSYDDALPSGELVQRNQHVSVAARTPDRLSVEVTDAGRDRRIWYDGETVTVYGALNGYYAQFDAPPTTAETVLAAEAEYDLRIPLADLFLWGMDDTDLDLLTSGFLVGPSRIGDRICNQFSFEQEGVDWQIWIEQGEAGMPCKLLIVDSADPLYPQWSATIEMLEDEGITDDALAFVLPDTARRIEILPVEAMQ